MTLQEFQQSIREGIPAELPAPKAYEPEINHAPKRKDILTKEEKKLAADAMEKMQITPLAKRCYRTLSGGQQQRVLLARALCATQKMLLLDEPVSGLDPKVTAEMYALIQKLNYEDGITVVMISHDLSAALQYASHILHIGDTVFFGTKAAYLNEFPQVWQKGGVAQ